MVPGWISNIYLESPCLNLYLGKGWSTSDVGNNIEITLSQSYPVNMANLDSINKNVIQRCNDIHIK